MRQGGHCTKNQLCAGEEERRRYVLETSTQHERKKGRGRVKRKREEGGWREREGRGRVEREREECNM